MKKTLRIVAALAVLAVAYVLIAFVIGRVIVSETERFSEALALQDGVTVNRLDYEAGLFRGVLRYDLDYVPPPDSLLGAAEWSGVRNARGEMDVRHGPWVGNGGALAAGEGRVEVPVALRSVLPGLPDEKALLDVKLRYQFARSVRAEFVWLEHDGPLVLDDALDTRGNVRLKGAKGWAEFDSSLSSFDFNYGVEAALIEALAPVEEAARLAFNGLRMQGELKREGEDWTGTLNTALDGFEFVGSDGVLRAEHLLADALLGIAGTAAGPRPSLKAEMTLKSFEVNAQEGQRQSSLRVSSVRADADLVEDWPQLWSGASALHLGNVETISEGLSVRSGAVSLDSVTTRRAALLDQTLTLKLGAVQFGQTQLGGGRVVMSVKGIDGQTLSQLIEVANLNTNTPPQATDQDVQQAMMQAVEATFAGTPAVAIEHAGLSVLQEDDVRSNLTLSIAAPTTTPVNWFALPARVKVQGGLSARLDAVNQLFRLGAEAEHQGRGLDAAVVRKIGDTRYAEWLAGMRQLPYVTVTADTVTSEVGFEGDVLTFNGQQVDPMLLLLMLTMFGEALGT
jgi:hypothetical protein